jgi:hypothetical protein
MRRVYCPVGQIAGAQKDDARRATLKRVDQELKRTFLIDNAEAAAF